MKGKGGRGRRGSSIGRGREGGREQVSSSPAHYDALYSSRAPSLSPADTYCPGSLLPPRPHMALTGIMPPYPALTQPATPTSSLRRERSPSTCPFVSFVREHTHTAPEVLPFTAVH